MKKSELITLVKEEIKHILEIRTKLSYDEAICVEARDLISEYFHDLMGGGDGRQPGFNLGPKIANIFGVDPKKGAKDLEKVFNIYKNKILQPNWEKFTHGQLKFIPSTFKTIDLGGSKNIKNVGF